MEMHLALPFILEILNCELQTFITEMWCYICAYKNPNVSD